MRSLLRQSLCAGVLTVGLFAQAYGDDTSCNFNLQCQLGSDRFQIAFSSPSNDCSEDDGEGQFIDAKGRSTKLALPAAWYMFTSHISRTQPSICKSNQEEFAAYDAGSGKVLFFVKKSHRPSYDMVDAILVDVKSGQLVDHKSLGQSKNQSVAVLKTAKGFKLRIVRDSLSFHKDVFCDCDAPFVDDWMEVSVSGGKIVSDWIL